MRNEQQQPPQIDWDRVLNEIASPPDASSSKDPMRLALQPPKKEHKVLKCIIQHPATVAAMIGFAGAVTTIGSSVFPLRYIHEDQTREINLRLIGVKCFLQSR